jgi:DNA-binding NtrC family response regulator
VDYFVRQISQTHHIDLLNIPNSYLSKLAEYEWPGNVRQLRSFVEQLILLCNGAFDPDTFYALTTELIPQNPMAKKFYGEMNLVDLQQKIENQRIENENQLLWQALRQTNFNKAETAKLMGISRTTLWRKLKDAKIP